MYNSNKNIDHIRTICSVVVQLIVVDVMCVCVCVCCRHVRRVVDIVRKIRPGIRILIWDDILRGTDIINNDKLVCVHMMTSSRFNEQLSSSSID
jgi:hypothetical protein